MLHQLQVVVTVSQLSIALARFWGNIAWVAKDLPRVEYVGCDQLAFLDWSECIRMSSCCSAAAAVVASLLHSCWCTLQHHNKRSHSFSCNNKALNLALPQAACIQLYSKGQGQACGAVLSAKG